MKGKKKHTKKAKCAECKEVMWIDKNSTEIAPVCDGCLGLHHFAEPDKSQDYLRDNRDDNEDRKKSLRGRKF